MQYRLYVPRGKFSGPVDASAVRNNRAHQGQQNQTPLGATLTSGGTVEFNITGSRIPDLSGQGYKFYPIDLLPGSTTLKWTQNGIKVFAWKGTEGWIGELLP